MVEALQRLFAVAGADQDDVAAIVSSTTSSGIMNLRLAAQRPTPWSQPSEAIFVIVQLAGAVSPNGRIGVRAGDAIDVAAQVGRVGPLGQARRRP